MKTIFVLALTAAGFLIAPPEITLAQDDDQSLITAISPLHQALLTPAVPKPPSFEGQIEFRHWQQGQPPVKLIRQTEGICALTSVGGHFAGAGERVRVYVGEDGYWYLGGQSMQDDVQADCMVIRFPTTVALTPLAAGAEAPVDTPPPAKGKKVKILAASYAFGSESADVTERVKALVKEGTTFQANPDWLKVDPHPYWNKVLLIFCKVGHQRAVFAAGENEDVSRELILKQARPVVAGKAGPKAD